MMTRHFPTRLAVLATALTVANAAAQVLSTPPLAPDELVFNTVTGCAVVGVWSEARQRKNGRTLAALKANLEELHFDRTCRPGELLTGHPGTVSRYGSNRPPNGIWYLFGRRFGVVEPTALAPTMFVIWQRKSASIPVGVDAAEGFEQQLRTHQFFSVIVNDDGSDVEVHASYKDEDGALPKEKRRFNLTVREGDRFQKHTCPPPEDARACFPVWQQHAGPVMKRAQEFLAESRPKIDALREAVIAHLRATGDTP
jgi:hypothetical protein